VGKVEHEKSNKQSGNRKWRSNRFRAKPKNDPLAGTCNPQNYVS
jgi:hypothetical protein